MKQAKEKSFLRLMVFRWFAPSVILLLVFMTFFLILLDISNRHNEELRLEHQQERLEQAMQSLEDNLQKIYYTQLEIINSVECNQFIYMYHDLNWFDRYAVQDALYDRIYLLRVNQQMITGVYMYVPSLEKTISDVRVSTATPAWLKDTIAGLHTQIAQIPELPQRIVMQAFTADGDAVLATLLDERVLYDQFQQVLINENASVELVWNDAETGESIAPDLTVEGKTLPLRLNYFAQEDANDQFIQTTVQLSTGFVIGGVLILALCVFIWYRQSYLPLHLLLIEAFSHMESGDLKYRIAIKPSSPFHSIYGSYNHMMDKMEAYVEKNLLQQVLVNRANLKQLQSQINPHFMYNSYYVLYRLIKKGDRESSMKLAENLGQFYQYITRNADDEKRLGEEVEHASIYASIQKFRFQDTLDVEIERPPEGIARVYVPRLILQPVLENAFKYAYETADGAMRLWVHFEVQTPYNFSILVENSGNVSEETVREIREKLANTDARAETTALVNIHRRLQIYFGPASGVEVERSSLGGLMIRLRIKDEREEEA